MALDRSLEFLKDHSHFFFCCFQRRISLCVYSVSRPHLLMLYLLTSKFREQFLKRVTQGTFL